MSAVIEWLRSLLLGARRLWWSYRWVLIDDMRSAKTWILVVLVALAAAGTWIAWSQRSG